MFYITFWRYNLPSYEILRCHVKKNSLVDIFIYVVVFSSCYIAFFTEIFNINFQMSAAVHPH